ncbi:hypothetical protein HH310_13905 [Actinoplanes sp. TBRC 11911]|uniref:hypothetical protein n=1 Tax=Actinoplanes sp. TBRC 11911 TaxID=2729386 RepID=UPI00145E079A|nr:hypothetical protein [Actinoplanes sp. TBRC 11911]NMO52287.1 hypothetical protein [Actinoplanes sp. TBRC 11911]
MTDNWRAAAARIDALATSPADEDLVRAVTDLYGAGLERMLDLLDSCGALTDPVVSALAADELVAGLLLVHGLHPYDAVSRVCSALAGTGAALVSLSPDGVCRVRIPPGHRPPGLAEAIEAAAPEVTRIEIEQPAPLIPVSALFSRPT